MRLLLLFCLALGAHFVWRTGETLPLIVASHFGFDGAANGSMPRDAYVAVMLGVTVLVPALLGFGAEAVRGLPTGLVNLPNRDYWLADERRAATMDSLVARLQWLACGLVGFLCVVQREVVVANTRHPPALSNRAFYSAVFVFVAIVVIWTTALHRRFARVP